MTAHYCISYPCPLCHPGYPNYYLPPQPQFYSTPLPAGCVCPPTSEKTCESPTCPRKNHLSAIGRGFVGSTDKDAPAKPAPGKGTA